MTLTDLAVVVSVGTDHHRFDRLVEWVDHWIAAQDRDIRCVAQVGTSKHSITGTSHALMSPIALSSAIAGAAAVVCHGGPGTIMDARRAGLNPIVVPRSARMGEHVDDHQERFARWMATHHELVVATEEAELHRLLDRVLVDPETYRRAPGNDDVADVTRRLGELVEGLLGPA